MIFQLTSLSSVSCSNCLCFLNDVILVMFLSHWFHNGSLACSTFLHEVFANLRIFKFRTFKESTFVNLSTKFKTINPINIFEHQFWTFSLITRKPIVCIFLKIRRKTVKNTFLSLTSLKGSAERNSQGKREQEKVLYLRRALATLTEFKWKVAVASTYGGR